MKIFVYILKDFQADHIEQLQNSLKPINKRDLFNNRYFQGVKVSDVDINVPYKRIKEALRSLNDKRIIIKTEEYEADARFIETPKYYEKKGMFDFMLNSELVPAFESLSQGFLRFSPDTLFKLNSHGQRFYLLMCQHEDTGIVKIHAKELRDLLEMKNKYPKYSVFKKWVIDTAEKEINALFERGECKLKFIYDKKLSKKITKNDDWNRMLHFQVISYNNSKRTNKIKEAKEKHAENFNLSNYILARIYDNNKPYLKTIMEFIINLIPEDIQILKDRLERLANEYQGAGKVLLNNVDAQKIVSTILKQDFGYIKKESFEATLKKSGKKN